MEYGASLTPHPRVSLNVPTVTIVVVDVDDQHRILVGTSAKHPYEVLPGGKIDALDLIGVTEFEGAAQAAQRELGEEVGIWNGPVRFLERMERPGADQRTVQRRDLEGSLAGALLGEGDPNEYVTAQYGVPDYVFVVAVKPDAVVVSSELPALRWLSLREQLPPLSGGHELIVARYLHDLRTRSPFQEVRLPPLPPQLFDEGSQGT